MNNFSIKFLGYNDNGFYEGQIQIGEFIERFKMTLNSWALDSYEFQWQKGIARLKKHSQSCLVTNIQETENPLIEWWVLYKVGKIVYVQNELIAGDCLQSFLKHGSFDRKTCYQFIEPRQTVTEDGEKISEWSFEL